jgi:hypothetical protein
VSLPWNMQMGRYMTAYKASFLWPSREFLMICSARPTVLTKRGSSARSRSSKRIRSLWNQDCLGEIISARTSAALQAAKARGKRLGNPKLSEARRHADIAKKEIADRYSANILPVIHQIQASGVKSLRGVARALAARGIPTARGGAWTRFK